MLAGDVDDLKKGICQIQGNLLALLRSYGLREMPSRGGFRSEPPRGAMHNGGRARKDMRGLPERLSSRPSSNQTCQSEGRQDIGER